MATEDTVLVQQGGEGGGGELLPVREIVEVTVKVEQEHIDHGARHQCDKCPIALAMTDVGFKDVHVGAWTMGFAGIMVRVKTPKAARLFMGRFDRGLNVKPFTFPITVPRSCLAATA